MKDYKYVLAVMESCGCCEMEYFFKSAKALFNALMMENLNSEDNIYWIGKDDFGDEFCIDIFWGYCIRDADDNVVDSYDLLTALSK